MRNRPGFKLKVPEWIRAIAKNVDHWQWIILLLSSPLFLFPDSRRCWILLVVPALWINSLFARRNPLPSTPINLSVLILVIMMLVSLFVSYDINLSLPNISNMIFSIGAFFLIVRMSNEESGWWYCLTAFLIIGIGITGISALGTKWFTDKFPVIDQITAYLPRITLIPGVSESFHPNIVSGALTWILPVYLAVTLFIISKWKILFSMFTKFRYRGVALVLLFLTLVMSGIFILTQSRSAYLGFFAASLIILFIVLKEERYRIIFIAVVVVSFIGVAFATRGFESLLSSMNSLGENGASIESLQSRMELWSRAIFAIEDFPLTGIGMGTFQHIVPVLYPLFSVGPDVYIGHAHNEFLQVALEWGTPGLIGFVSVYLGSFMMIARTWSGLDLIIFNKISDLRTRLIYKFLLVGLLGGMLAHMIFSLTDAVFLTSKPGFIFWLLVGLITGLYQRIVTLSK